MQYMNNMRGFAILIIAYTHAIWAMPAPGDATAFLDYLVGNGTLIFIFIAGYLFSKTTDNFNYVDYMQNKFRNIIVPYLVLSLPASLFYVFHIKTTHQWIDMDWFFGNLNVVERYLYLTVTGAQLGPLWFVPMVVVFFLVSPVFIRLKNSALLVPLIPVTLAIAYVAGRPVGNSNPLHSFVFFMPFYLLGMAYFRYTARIEKFAPYSNVALALYSTFLVSMYFLIFKEPEYSSDSNQLILYVPLVIILSLFFKQNLNRRIPVLDMFGRLSFFIFFIHGYFAAAFLGLTRRIFGENGLHDAPVEVIVITLIFIGIVFLSLAAYVVLKFLLKDRSRYLIGG